VLFHDEQVTYFDDGHKAHVSVADALGDKRVVLIKNHGAIVASQTLEHATIEAVMLEEAARYHLECEAAGGTEIALDEVVAGKAMYQKYFLPNMWDANFGRLRTSDPDLFAWLD
jgi:ribulose-5-phosphate 4-epimerase/fuculose-1-phosphate aldolase